MRYLNNKVEDVQIAYIGGGSRGWAWTFMTDLALEESISGTIRLYDINKEAAKANEIIGNRVAERDDAVGKWIYRTTDTLEEALTGADFVVISILPKTFDEMEVDVHMPERLGIYQSVGDTAGPGGTIRALRTLPMFAEFAEAIKKYSPDAWVINYTNPMALCVRTLYHVFPQIKAFGCCHEVFGTQSMLARVLDAECGIKDVKRQEIQVNVLGINHFTWFDYASYKGMDIFPIYTQYVEKNHINGHDMRVDNWVNNMDATADKVKMDLFRRYGLIAAAGDRHLAEFMPGDEYLMDPQLVAAWGYGLTPVSWRKDNLKKRMARSARLVSGEEELTLKPTGEEGIQLIKALCGLTRMVSNVNVPNTGKQIANFPEDAVVETNALFERNAIRPIQAGSIPENMLELFAPHIENQARVLEAALTDNKELVVEAFKTDPLVKGKGTDEEIRKLVDDMIEATL